MLKDRWVSNQYVIWANIVEITEPGTDKVQTCDLYTRSLKPEPVHKITKIFPDLFKF